MKNTGSGKRAVRPVRVSIKSRTVDLLDENAVDIESADVIEYSTDGDMILEGEQVLISYGEPKGLGMDDTVTSVIFDRSNPEYINVARSGGVGTALVFDPAVKRRNCALNTAGAGIEFSILTRSVSNCVTPESGGDIELDYLIEFHGIKTERNKFSMKVTPDDHRPDRSKRS